MNPEDFDRELTRLFTERRRTDEASAPGFRELLARARAAAGGRAFAGRAREGKWAWRAAAAAAASLALATGLYLLLPEPQPRLFSDAATLAAWKAPTDALLQTPGAELFSRVPVLVHSHSVPEGDAGTATPQSTPTQVPHSKGVES